jgi:hypothetical protein
VVSAFTFFFFGCINNLEDEAITPITQPPKPPKTPKLVIYHLDQPIRLSHAVVINNQTDRTAQALDYSYQEIVPEVSAGIGSSLQDWLVIRRPDKNAQLFEF